MRKNLFLIAILALYSGSIMASEIIGIDDENAPDPGDTAFEYLESPEPSPVQLTFKDILGYGLNKPYNGKNWLTRISDIAKTQRPDIPENWPLDSSINFNNAHTNAQEAQQAMTESQNTELPYIPHNEPSDSSEDLDSVHTDFDATEPKIAKSDREIKIESLKQGLRYIGTSDNDLRKLADAIENSKPYLTRTGQTSAVERIETSYKKLLQNSGKNTHTRNKQKQADLMLVKALLERALDNAEKQ